MMFLGNLVTELIALLVIVNWLLSWTQLDPFLFTTFGTGSFSNLFKVSVQGPTSHTLKEALFPRGLWGYGSIRVDAIK